MKAINITMNYNIINTTRALQPVNDISTKNKL